jgi:hypothetical protein
MEIKKDLFSFHGLVLTALHDVFIVGVVGVVILGAFAWTGNNPFVIKTHPTGMTQEDAISVLLDLNPGHDVKLVPFKGGKNG